MKSVRSPNLTRPQSARKQSARKAAKLVALAFGLILVLGACGRDGGAPESFETSSVEEYFLDGCRVSLEDGQYDNMDAVCQCSFDRMSTQIDFEDFEGLNNRLRDDPSILQNPEQDSVAPRAVQIISDCIDSVPLGSSNSDS